MGGLTILHEYQRSSENYAQARVLVMVVDHQGSNGRASRRKPANTPSLLVTAPLSRATANVIVRPMLIGE
jgi:hypothetical protein